MFCSTPNKGFAASAASASPYRTPGILGVLPQPVWQELTHKLMLAEAFMLGQITGRIRPDSCFETRLVKGFALYRDKVKALATLGLALSPVPKRFDGQGLRTSGPPRTFDQ